MYCINWNRTLAGFRQERLRFWSDPDTELKLAKDTGVSVFRMGIDWSRIMPGEPIRGVKDAVSCDRIWFLIMVTVTINITGWLTNLYTVTRECLSCSCSTFWWFQSSSWPCSSVVLTIIWVCLCGLCAFYDKNQFLCSAFMVFCHMVDIF